MRVRSYPTMRRLNGFGAAREGGGSDSPDTFPAPAPSPEIARTVQAQGILTPDGFFSITVRWTAPEMRSPKDWVGIYRPGAPNSPSIAWKYVPTLGVGGILEFQVPPDGSYVARYFLDDGYGLAASSGPITVPIALPPPPPAPSPIIDIGQISAEFRAKRDAAIAIVNLAAGPAPLDNPSQLIPWVRNVFTLRASNPALSEAIAFIEAAYPPKADGSGGLFGALSAAGNAVVDGVRFIGGAIARGANAIAGVAGSIIDFVAGGFPTPADYEPENLCVTAWTDPPKFALLSAVAAIVFPPALLYMGVYVPPNVTGLTLGLAEALAKGGPERAISKILDPLYNAVADLAGALLDYAFNGNAALVRWAIKKVADRLPDDVLKGILLACSEAADSIVEVIQSANKLKDEAFYVGLGDAITRASQKFFEGNRGLRDTLSWIGDAIKGGGAAIATLVEKGAAGVQEAFAKLAEKVLGIPADFDRLTEKAKAEIAAAKAQIMEGGKSPLDLFHAFVSNLRSGVAAVADALRKLPLKIGQLLGGLIDLLGQLIAKAEAFIAGLMGLAQRWMEGAFNPPPPPVVVTPTPIPGPIPTEPTPASSGSLLLILGGGLVGGLLGGPVGAGLGAGAGAFLGKGK